MRMPITMTSPTTAPTGILITIVWGAALGEYVSGTSATGEVDVCAIVAFHQPTPPESVKLLVAGKLFTGIVPELSAEMVGGAKQGSGTGQHGSGGHHGWGPHAEGGHGHMV